VSQEEHLDEAASLGNPRLNQQETKLDRKVEGGADVNADSEREMTSGVVLEARL
jgi:hypothetical protein